MTNLLILSNAISRGVSQTVSWLIDYMVEIAWFIVLILLLCGIAMGIRYLWRRWIKNGINWTHNKLIYKPWMYLTRPVRRLHRRYSERIQGKKMAKWKRGHLADVFLNVLYEEAEAGRISKQEFRRLQNEMGKFFNLPDLIRRKTNKQELKARLLANKEHTIGPKGVIPGGKPGKNVVPLYEGLGHKYLSQKKQSA